MTRHGLSEDRTVHARCPQFEVVRYDRAGKWYVEYADTKKSHKQVSLNDAVFHVENGQAEVFFGRRGGALFDRKVRHV